MKTTKLQSTYHFDFFLIGLVCNISDHRLAWNINNVLDIELERQEDLKIEFSNGSHLHIGHFLFKNDIVEFELLRNKLINISSPKNQFLLPELKQFDFFVKFKDLSFEYDIDHVLKKLKQLQMIEYIMRVNFATLKSKENLLY